MEFHSIQGYPGSGLDLANQCTARGARREPEPFCVSLLFFCVLLVATSGWRRLHVQYRMWPWRLVCLIDPRVSQQSKDQVCSAFSRARPCCLDIGCSVRLRSQLREDMDVKKLLQEEFRSVIDSLSVQKVTNSQIENNFARCVSAAKCARGACNCNVVFMKGVVDDQSNLGIYTGILICLLIHDS